MQFKQIHWRTDIASKVLIRKVMSDLDIVHAFRTQTVNDDRTTIVLLLTLITPVITTKECHRISALEVSPWFPCLQGISSTLTGVIKLSCDCWQQVSLELLQCPKHFSADLDGKVRLDWSSFHFQRPLGTVVSSEGQHMDLSTVLGDYRLHVLRKDINVDSCITPTPVCPHLSLFSSRCTPLGVTHQPCHLKPDPGIKRLTESSCMMWLSVK